MLLFSHEIYSFTLPLLLPGDQTEIGGVQAQLRAEVDRNNTLRVSHIAETSRHLWSATVRFKVIPKSLRGAQSQSPETMVATSTQTRGLDTFPTELLVEIFKHLDYVTIAARVRPTCRRFHAVIQTARDGALAYNMFRAPLQLRPPKHWHRRDIAWHPCISFLTIDIGASSNFTLKDIYIVHPSPTARRQNGIRLLDTDMLGDNISEPAVTWVRANYRLKIACKFWGKDDGAITVRDLMEGYLKTLNRWSGELPCYHRTCPSKMPLKACPKKHDQVQNLGKVFRLVD